MTKTAGGGQPSEKVRWQHVGQGPSGHPRVAAGAFCDHGCGAWLGELGTEPTLELYVEHIVEVFREVRRVLRDDGTLWLNMGDSYACSPNGRSAAKTKEIGKDDRTFRDKPFSTAGPRNKGFNERWGHATGDAKQEIQRPKDGGKFTGAGLKPKDLCGIPWRVAFALQADGWYLRSDCVWSKTNPMPSSVKDRPAMSHEYVFLLSKKSRYFYDSEAVREASADPVSQARSRVKGRGNQAYNLASGFKGSPQQDQSGGYPSVGRNRRSVWTFPTQPFSAKKVGVEGVDHFATFPEALVEPCVMAGTSEGGCCAACGASYRRIVEPTPEYAALFGSNEGADADRHGEGYRKHSPAVTADYRTVGWEATCDCAERAKVIEPCVEAGTSEQGCCQTCGAPWERITETTYENPGNRTTNGPRSLERRHETAGFATRLEKHVETMGWRATCDCATKPVPCVVLDPFAGSGTVGVVASRLGRHAVLLELNEQYCEIARRRCGDAVRDS